MQADRDVSTLAPAELGLAPATRALPPPRRSYVGVVSLCVAIVGAVACRVALAFDPDPDPLWLRVVTAGFEAAMVEVALRFDPGFDAGTLERRPSKAGNYLGLTLTVTATSREQLDDLYRAFSSHPMVKVVL